MSVYTCHTWKSSLQHEYLVSGTQKSKIGRITNTAMKATRVAGADLTWCVAAAGQHSHHLGGRLLATEADLRDIPARRECFLFYFDDRELLHWNEWLLVDGLKVGRGTRRCLAISVCSACGPPSTHAAAALPARRAPWSAAGRSPPCYSCARVARTGGGVRPSFSKPVSRVEAAWSRLRPNNANPVGHLQTLGRHAFP